MLFACKETDKPEAAAEIDVEPYRPAFHFTPVSGWMNDPNGMVYDGTQWHLFYQYYPDSTVWGPMHWGHAASTDLVHWKHLPIALYPDSLGYIFSGSAVLDSANTSGFGKDGVMPLVAIYTNHDTTGEKSGKQDFQTQSIAYSLDKGNTWTKYAGNPVLKNPGIRDFRDPKVQWYAPGKKWIMTLAVADHIAFYSSPDLKQWTHESDFGKTAGAHGGVWECPDLFAMECGGETIWVLIVNINPGGPNGGSACQYFTGHFDGATFKANHTETKWMDYGTDNYAGITWSNTGNRHIFLGWMSNWQYGQQVPTEKWRSAMTIPRELSMQKVGDQYYVASTPVKEMTVLQGDKITMAEGSGHTIDLTADTGVNPASGRLTFTLDKAASFALEIANASGDTLVLGYDAAAKQYFIDRSKSGLVNFEQGFGKKQVAPRLSADDMLTIDLVLDKASVELFADGGLTTMTAIFFPRKPLTGIMLTTNDSAKVSNIRFYPIKAMKDLP